MSKYFSKSTNGFYDKEIHDTMPDDVVEISDEKWEELINSEKCIVGDENGYPILVEPEVNLKAQLERQFNKSLETPIMFQNHQYKIVWKDKLISLYNTMFDDEEMRIYDITGTVENSVLMDKETLKSLIKLLKSEYESRYQSYKLQLEKLI